MSHLRAAMRQAATELDARGLVPLAEARRLLSRKRVFRRGESLEIGDRHVLEADLLWAALLSLADAAEFVRIASRLRWDHPPRGRDNDAPWERYGDAILPWLEAALGPDGRYPPNLWTALPCLVHVGGERALDLVLRVRRAGFLAEWLDLHPAEGEVLGRRAVAGDDDAGRALLDLAKDDPALVRELVGADPAGVRWIEAAGLPAPDPRVAAALAEVRPIAVPSGRALTASRVAAHLREFDYPMWDNANYATGAMRVTGFVSPGGDALVFQSICTGLGSGNVRREVHRFGPPGGALVSSVELLPEDALFVWEGDELVCVATGVRRTRDGRYVSPPGGSRDTVLVPLVGADVPLAVDTRGMNPRAAAALGALPVELALMARLGQDHRDAVFLDDGALAELAGLEPTAMKLFTFDGFVSPRAGEPVGASLDWVAMIEALRRRLPITRLPLGGHPLAGLLERELNGHLSWGDPRFRG